MWSVSAADVTTSDAHPFLGIQIQVLNLSMLEEARQTNPVVRQMLFFANDYNIVLSPLDVILH
jgi:hypothetical protein